MLVKKAGRMTKISSLAENRESANETQRRLARTLAKVASLSLSHIRLRYWLIDKPPLNASCQSGWSRKQLQQRVAVCEKHKSRTQERRRESYTTTTSKVGRFIVMFVAMTTSRSQNLVGGLGWVITFARLLALLQLHHSNLCHLQLPETET